MRARQKPLITSVGRNCVAQRPRRHLFGYAFLPVSSRSLRTIHFASAHSDLVSSAWLNMRDGQRNRRGYAAMLLLLGGAVSSLGACSPVCRSGMRAVETSFGVMK